MREVDLDEACRVLRQGDILIYPTETVYGLGVDIQNPKALEKLFSLKGRDPDKPVSVLISSPRDLSKVAGELSPKAHKILATFLPGPLTMVVRAQTGLDPRIHGGSGWVGFRISSHPQVQQLMDRWGGPITSTSANPSGESSGQNLAQIKDYFGREDVYFLDGGAHQNRDDKFF